MVDYAEWNHACAVIWREGPNWARNYAGYGLKAPPGEWPIQALYILNNITHWRHPEAKAIRAVLKRTAALTKKGAGA